jgi:hypothetical protein
MRPDRFHSVDSEHLKNYLNGCVTSAGDSAMYLEDDDIHIAVIHDSSGFNPTAAIAVSESNTQEALEEAFDHLKDFLIENYACHVRELQKEHGDEWEAVLTEPFDGMTWTLSPHVAAGPISDDRFAHRHVSIYPAR